MFRRSRRQRGILAFLARDANARILVHANARIRKKNRYGEILRFAQAWKQRSGEHHPRELIFDSGLTTYAGLATLNQW